MKIKFPEKIKIFTLYLFRWQMSTPILWICIIWLSSLPALYQTFIANLIGGIIFFFVDSRIFNITKKFKDEVWESVEKIQCSECGKIEKGYRLLYKKKNKYDRIYSTPEFRCHECSQKKYKELNKC